MSFSGTMMMTNTRIDDDKKTVVFLSLERRPLLFDLQTGDTRSKRETPNF